jgi:GT2 family glycosyltransferase
LGQTYNDWELIVVSDGEDSEARAVVEAFSDPRIHFYEIPHFGNHSRPKNYGTNLAKGEFICYLDDDNAFRPDHINALYKELERNPNVDVAYGDRWVVDDDGKTKSQVGAHFDYDPVRLIFGNYIDGGDAMIRREALFAVGGWDERYQKYLDWQLWIRMQKNGSLFKRVPLILSDYYMHTDTMSRKLLDSKGMNQPAWDARDTEVEVPYLKEIKEPKVAIFSISYDRKLYTKLSFESLQKFAGYPFKHYVWDNGSTDGSVEYLQRYQKQYKNVEVVYNTDNQGISIPSNRLAEMALKDGYDIIVKSDNDCIYQTSDWLAKMVEIYKANHRFAMSCYVQGLKDNPGGAPRIDYGTLRGELIGITKHLGGICHFVSADAYKNWKWNEDQPLHGIQDLEMSQHLLAAGYQMGYLENFYVSHGPAGTEGQYKDYKAYFERRRLEKTKIYEPTS